MTQSQKLGKKLQKMRRKARRKARYWRGVAAGIDMALAEAGDIAQRFAPPYETQLPDAAGYPDGTILVAGVGDAKGVYIKRSRIDAGGFPDATQPSNHPLRQAPDSRYSHMVFSPTDFNDKDDPLDEQTGERAAEPSAFDDWEDAVAIWNGPNVPPEQSAALRKFMAEIKASGYQIILAPVDPADEDA